MGGIHLGRPYTKSESHNPDSQKADPKRQNPRVHSTKGTGSNLYLSTS